MLSTIAEKVKIIIDSIECFSQSKGGQKNADLLNLS